MFCPGTQFFLYNKTSSIDNTPKLNTKFMTEKFPFVIWHIFGIDDYDRICEFFVHIVWITRIVLELIWTFYTIESIFTFFFCCLVTVQGFIGSGRKVEAAGNSIYLQSWALNKSYGSWFLVLLFFRFFFQLS